MSAETVSPALRVPSRSREAAALDKAETALLELLAVIDLVDELAPEACHAVRHIAGIAEARHHLAKVEARKAIQDIWTLQGKG